MMPLLKNAQFTNEKKVHTNFISREFLNFVQEKEKQDKYFNLLAETY